MKKLWILALGLALLSSLSHADSGFSRYPAGGSGITGNSCAANTFADAISNTGVLTCASVPDAALGSSYLKADGSRGLSANWNAGAFNITASTFIGALTGNASTSTALSATPTGCSSNQVATSIASSGNLGCVSLTGSFLPNPGATSLGGIESYAAVSHQWINAVSTLGVPSSTQPAFSDISGTASLTTQVSGVLPTANGGTGQNSTATFPTSGTVLTDANTVSPVGNKSIALGLTGSLSNFVDVTDNTKVLRWDLSGIGTTTTRTITAVNASGTLVLDTNSQQLQNKNILDNSTIGNVTTTTKKLGFDLSGATASTTMTLKSSQTGNQTLTLPNATDTLVGKGTTDILTNKTINGFAVNINGTAKTSAYTVTATDDVILASSSGGAFTVTLPSASSAGRMVTVTKTDSSANAVTVSRAGTDTIAGQTTTVLLSQYESIRLVSDGTATWYYVTPRDASRIGRVALGVSSACTTGTCTLSNSNNVISSVTNGGTGVYTVNFATSAFSAAPVCTATCNGISAFSTAAISTSSAGLLTFTVAGAAGNQQNINITCTGPR